MRLYISNESAPDIALLPEIVLPVDKGRGAEHHGKSKHCGQTEVELQIISDVL